VPDFVAPLDRHGGVPVLSGTAAVIVADTAAAHDCGDHTIFVGHVASMSANDRPPLLYHGSRFASLVTLREASPSVPEFW
jgi:flavin reductase (DIM6/NTAB) family NADH-FMN oxidoreductase RutF